MQGIASFAELAATTSTPVITERFNGAIALPEEFFSRLDGAVKEVPIAIVATVVKGFPFRKRELLEAMAELGGAWFLGYALARSVYGTTLTALHYSDSETATAANSQRLIDFIDGADPVEIFEAIPWALDAFRKGLADAPEYQTVVRRLGVRNAVGCLVTIWAEGVATAIAEHRLFPES